MKLSRVIEDGENMQIQWCKPMVKATWNEEPAN